MTLTLAIKIKGKINYFSHQRNTLKSLTQSLDAIKKHTRSNFNSKIAAESANKDCFNESPSEFDVRLIDL